MGFTLIFLFPLLLAGYYEFFQPPELHPQPHSTWSFFISTAVCFLFGWFFYVLGKNAEGIIYRREALLIVCLIWFCAPIFGGMPFVISHTLNNPIHAYFEATSGFTTTGFSTMVPKIYDEGGQEIAYTKTIRGAQDTTYTFYGTITPVIDPDSGQILHEGIEAVGKALLFWRSFLQWIGGGGIIVLFVAVLPALGVGGKQLFYQEVSGPVKESITPRIKETASNLWFIYLAISFLQVFFLMITNEEMPFFDALTITFSTVSTGGLSIKNESIGAYNSAATDWVVIVFMIMGGINFTLYYYLFTGKLFRLYDKELFLFLGLLLFQSLLCSYEIYGAQKILMDNINHGIFNSSEALRYATFEVVSSQTSTGFSTANFDLWPYPSQVIILVAMFFGGMAGSTAGGIKTIRLYILFRVAQFKVETLFRPETVRRFRIGSNEIEWEAVIKVLVFFLIVIAVTMVSTYILVWDGIDPESAFTIVSGTTNNSGVGFRIVGPVESFAALSNFSVALSAFLMILGRLEFLAILAILVPAFWKSH